jgi:DNA polymerase-3 subunit alpha
MLAPARLKIKEDLLEYCSSGHPLDDFADAWEQFVKLDLSKPESAPEEEYTLIGILSSLRPITTKAGKDMAFGSLADYRGEIDLVFFPRAWTNSKEKLTENQCVALKGKLDKSREKPSFQVSSVLETDKLRKKAAKNAVSAERPGEETGPDTETLAAQAYGSPDVARETSLQIPPAPVWRELHIRLKDAACEREENLYSLRDYLYDNSGPCSVFIHVPEAAETATVDSGSAGTAETVIRAASGIGVTADAPCIEALSLYAAVAEVWGA